MRKRGRAGRKPPDSQRGRPRLPQNTSVQRTKDVSCPRCLSFFIDNSRDGDCRADRFWDWGRQQVDTRPVAEKNRPCHRRPDGRTPGSPTPVGASDDGPCEHRPSEFVMRRTRYQLKLSCSTRPAFKVMAPYRTAPSQDDAPSIAQRSLGVMGMPPSTAHPRDHSPHAPASSTVTSATCDTKVLNASATQCRGPCLRARGRAPSRLVGPRRSRRAFMRGSCSSRSRRKV